MSKTKTIKRCGLLFAAVALFALLIAPSASADPRWSLYSLSNSTVKPGEELTYLITIANVGPDPFASTNDNGTPGDSSDDFLEKAPFTLRIELPPGVKGVSTIPVLSPAVLCPGVKGATGTITCEGKGIIRYSRLTALYLTVDTDGASGELLTELEVEGGGIPNVTAADTTLVTEAPPSFAIDAFDTLLADAKGKPFTQAAATPYDYTTWIDFSKTFDELHESGLGAIPGFPATNIGWPVEETKDVYVDLPPGLIGNPSAVPECEMTELMNQKSDSDGDGVDDGIGQSICPPASQVGTVSLRYNAGVGSEEDPRQVYNMVPPVGVAARLGFMVAGTPVTIDATVREGDYGITAKAENIAKALAVTGTKLTLWGVPASEEHRFQRGCPNVGPPNGGNEEGGSSSPSCASQAAEIPFLRTPTSCTPAGSGLVTNVKADSWIDPGDFVESSTYTHEPPGDNYPRSMWGPEIQGVSGCEVVPVQGELSVKPTTRDAQTSSGLGVRFEVPNPGLEDADSISSSDIKKVRVALPEGVTINPSQAQGLGACTQAQLASTELSFFPTDKGCPEDSKIGTVEVETPLLRERIKGDVYVAQPYENPFGSLLALYVVLASPERGVLVKVAGKVETDPVTGQITTTFDDLPQQPFSVFTFHFREGTRAPLVTPAACGTYTTDTRIWGHSDPNGTPVLSKSKFVIDRGIGGGPCPRGGLPPFRPLLQAGMVNNAAGSYSPFNLRLLRTDAEQEFTSFSTKLPPGLSGKLAGIEFCPDAAIAASKQRSGAEELASPSCPAASELGRTLSGAGVGSGLTYVPGKIYLAGPYNGSQLSLAAITAAKVGPFDLGTVVVREAIRIDPITAEVFIDATGSDPIPHIIDGITVHLRDIRAYVERSQFTLNPTSCDPTSTASTVLGSGLDFSSNHDDEPVVVSTRFQAADCAALGFRPKLSLRLIGGTKRGDHPKLRAQLKMRKGEANIAKAQVTLPRSAFLDQSHIGTVCTRVQYRQDACPARSVYGYAKGITPLLDEPIQGPVYLRSSENKLPDLVAALKSGKIEIDLSGRIDSFGKGRIRTSFETVPDAPVSSFVLTMKGGNKGLIINSANLCRGRHRAIVAFDAHNGKVSDSTPMVRAKCRGKRPRR